MIQLHRLRNFSSYPPPSSPDPLISPVLLQQYTPSTTLNLYLYVQFISQMPTIARTGPGQSQAPITQSGFLLGVTGIKLPELSLLPLRVHISKKLEWSMQP